jgi:hypothetical protein
MRRRTMFATVALLVASAAVAQSWSVFKSDRFGFAMLVAPGTKWAARDFGDGWGGIAAERGVLQFFALTKMSSWPEADAMERAAVRLTNIPSAQWRLVDDGNGRTNGLGASGWKRWRTYLAHGPNGRMVYAVLGHGSRGAYLLLLGTTQADYLAHERQYQQWYASLTLY